ncbi:MAG: TIGR03960 family B12-binding radical SAM protein [bacterium]
MSDRLNEVLPLVARPIRYTNAEYNALAREPAPGMVRWVLGMPEVYELGTSNYGLRILYSILNRTTGALCDRVYAPWPDFGALLRGRGIPLYALESKRPVRSFDIVGLSLQSELSYTNVPYLLELAGIPLVRERRGATDPLVIAGGPCTVNPLPLAGFFDAFVIGDGEEAVVDITRVRAGWDGRDREALRAALAGIPGLYVPGHSPRAAGAVRRRAVAELREEDFPLPPLVPVCEVTHDRLTLEIARGCTRGCRFCQAGMLNRPVRFRDTGQVLRLAERGIRESGWEEVSLLSLSALDYPDLLGLVGRLNAQFRDRRVAISLPSTRGEDFSAELAFDLQEVKKTGLTFAPETASPRLKALVNKNISELRTLEAVRTAIDGGWNGVKLYFMLGLPTETDADLDEMVRFVDEVARICRGRTVRYSLSPFVPKPHTPLQWAGFAGIEELRAKLDRVRGRLARRNVKAKWEDPASSYLQAVLARGDERLGPVIEHVYRSGGLFQEWSEHFDFSRWQAAFESCGVDPAPHVAGRAPGEPLAWDLIDTGVSPDYLRREWERAGRGEPTPDCAGAACTGCGVCPDATPPARPEPSSAVERAYRRRFQPAAEPGPKVRFRVRHSVGEEFRWAGHLDRVRALYRSLRRSGLPVAYTHGFSPKPMLSFGPPLPVGLASNAEYFDVFFVAGYSGDIVRDLGPFLPRGLGLEAGRAVPRDRPTLGKEINLGRYRVAAGVAPDGIADRARLVPGFRSATPLPGGALEFELVIAPGVRLFPALARLTEIAEPAVRTLEVRRLDCLIDRGGPVRTPLED